MLPRIIRRQVRSLDALHRFDAIHFLNVVSLLGSLPGRQGQYATINSHQAFCPKGNLFFMEREPCAGCVPLKYLRCMASSRYVGKVRVPWWLRLNPLFLLLLYLNYLRFRRGLRNVLPVAVSNDVAARLSAQCPGCPVIPNFPPTFRSSPSRRRTKVSIVYLGSLEAIKGVHLLLGGYRMLPPSLAKKTRLIIVGDGHERAALEASAPPGALFVGHLSGEKAWGILAKSDIVVLPSLWPEPLSRVLLEAAAEGKAVIATNLGGNPDVIGDAGLLVEPSEQSLAESLQRLVSQSSLRHTLGRKLRKRYLAHFSREVLLNQLERLYHQRDVV